jgi:hypothetical protein
LCALNEENFFNKGPETNSVGKKQAESHTWIAASDSLLWGQTWPAVGIAPFYAPVLHSFSSGEPKGQLALDISM